VQAAEWEELFQDVKSSNFDIKRDWASGSAAAYGPPTLERTVSVDSVSGVLPLLRNMDDEEAKKKLGIIADIRSNFGFDVGLTPMPNAVNTMLSGICRRAGRCFSYASPEPTLTLAGQQSASTERTLQTIVPVFVVIIAMFCSWRESMKCSWQQISGTPLCSKLVQSKRKFNV